MLKEKDTDNNNSKSSNKNIYIGIEFCILIIKRSIRTSRIQFYDDAAVDEDDDFGGDDDDDDGGVLLARNEGGDASPLSKPTAGLFFSDKRP